MTIIKGINKRLSLPGSDDMHLTWDNLRELCDEPLITIGAHTHRHFPLTQCDDTLSKEEITLSKDILEEMLPLKIKHFCYPRGQAEDFNENHIDTIKDLNMISSTTTISGVNRADTNLYKLHRIGHPQIIRSKEFELIWYVAAIPQLISQIKSYLFNRNTPSI